MSGGSYNYAYVHIQELADAIAVGHSNPSLRMAFKEHLHKVALACKAIEWNDSGDGDDKEDELIKAVIAPGAQLQEAIKIAEQAMFELEHVLETSR